MVAHHLSAHDLACFAHDAVAGHDVAPLLVLVRPDGDELCLLVPPPEAVAGLGLLDLALGVVAPPDCVAVAVAAPGRAWPDGGGPLEVVVAHALVRSGQQATVLTRTDGGPGLLDERGAGLVPDLCHRLLGLPTTPPEVETDAYLERLWLDRLLAVAVAGPGSLGWSQAWRLHPAASGAGVVGGGCELAATSRRLALEVPWAVLRRRVAGGGLGRVAEAAAWFDDGSFSRWMLRHLPGPQEALDVLADLVAGTVLREVRAATGAAAERG